MTIIIGPYAISDANTPDKVWISHASGEGGEFKRSDFEPVLTVLAEEKYTSCLLSIFEGVGYDSSTDD